MDTALEKKWEVYALKYAVRSDRKEEKVLFLMIIPMKIIQLIILSGY